eukprot:m.187030 g.187030  ORF g.187030 m.187030 type:complete len:116 (-) comp25609_c0_seq1:85-432(-)
MSASQVLSEKVSSLAARMNNLDFFETQPLGNGKKANFLPEHQQRSHPPERHVQETDIMDVLASFGETLSRFEDRLSKLEQQRFNVPKQSKGEELLAAKVTLLESRLLRLEEGMME